MNLDSVKPYFGRVRRGLEEQLELGEDTVGQSRRVKGYLQAARRELRAEGKKARTLDVEGLEDLVPQVLQAERKTEFEMQAWAYLFCGSLFRQLSPRGTRNGQQGQDRAWPSGKGWW
jgi:hypothetical protein